MTDWIPMSVSSADPSHDLWIDNDGDRITQCMKCGAIAPSMESRAPCPNAHIQDNADEWRNEEFKRREELNPPDPYSFDNTKIADLTPASINLLKKHIDWEFENWNTVAFEPPLQIMPLWVFENWDNFALKPDRIFPPCTCHPDEAPKPCQHRYALNECLTAAKGGSL